MSIDVQPRQTQTTSSAPDARASQPRRVLAGRYELDRRIGIGGMAEVYLARDYQTMRDVAVKVLAHSFSADTIAVERLRREAVAAASLRHPNIVSIYDRGESDGEHYVVMEFVPGPNLKEAIRRRGSLSEDEALDIAAQVAAALEAAHHHGIVHCDVKPHNILLDPDGRARVVDFGIARTADMTQSLQAAALVGSAHYLSPEQAQGAPVDCRTDLYSLGVVLFEMLTGQPPFDGQSAIAIARQHVDDAPPSPNAYQSGISRGTAVLLEKALAKNPADRFQSAGEMRAALVHARVSRLDERSPAVPLTTSGSASAAWLPRPARRRRLVDLATAAVLGVLGISLIGLGIMGAVSPSGVPTAGAAPATVQNDVTAPGLAPPANSSTAPIATHVRVPEALGQTVEAARTTLRAAGLAVGNVEERSSIAMPAGRIVAQSPRVGSLIARGGKVDLVVSTGSATSRSSGSADRSN